MRSAAADAFNVLLSWKRGRLLSWHSRIHEHAIALNREKRCVLAGCREQMMYFACKARGVVVHNYSIGCNRTTRPWSLATTAAKLSSRSARLFVYLQHGSQFCHIHKAVLRLLAGITAENSVAMSFDFLRGDASGAASPQATCRSSVFTMPICAVPNTWESNIQLRF